MNHQLIKKFIQNNRFAEAKDPIPSDSEQLISEAMRPGAINKAVQIATRYLQKKTGNKNLFASAGLEHFKNSNVTGYGARFYAPGKKIESWRLNWKSMSGDFNTLHSIDFWTKGGATGSTQGPTNHLAFESPVSLSQILPLLVDVLKTGNLGKTGPLFVPPKDIPLNESVVQLDEAFTPEDTFDGVLKILSSGEFTKNQVWKTYKSLGVKIFDLFEVEYPEQLQKAGRSYVWNADSKKTQEIAKERDRILDQVGATRAVLKSGSAKEKYMGNEEVDALENQREKLAYEDQLKDLTNLIKMTISGASNALFIAGRGGIGKTHTTEQVLADAGLKDGQGYFKNTGTASSAGLYRLLFEYKDEIILFDDSDDALKDQEARNLIKAATDTKKVRKLVYNKAGKNVVDLDDYDGSDDDLLADGKIPRTFEFTGKVIFISNLSLDKLDPDGAIRTRAFIIDINPTDIEVYDFMEKIVDKIKLDDTLHLDNAERRKIVELLRKSTSKQTPNLRKLSRALNMKAGAVKSGVNISDADLTRMISTYA
jgi:hypothetical protein